MNLYVIKHDGCRVPFNLKCIQDAIAAAASSVEQQSHEFAQTMAV